MKNAAKKTWVKVMCAFFALLFAALAGVSAGAVMNLAVGGVYSGGDYDTFESSMMQDRMNFDIGNVEANFDLGTGTVNSSLYQQYSSVNSNFYYTVKDASGNVVMKNYNGDTSRAHLTRSFYAGNNTAYTIDGYVRRNLTANDGYRSIAAEAEWMYAAKGWIFATMCISIVMYFALLVYLCYGAGRREGTDVIAASWLDKIPCDLYTAALLLLMYFPLAAGASNNMDESSLLYVFMGCAGAGEGLLFLLLCMTWKVRFRLKKWWRNSVVFYVIHWFKKPVCSLGRLIKSLPLIWKTALIVLAALILQLITYEDRNGFMWFLVNAAIALAVLYGAVYARKLREAASAMAEGHFEHKIDTSKMHWEFKTHGDDLNRIGDGIALAVEERMKSEHMKTELITNVSHDIKTPLTSIINYVDLLKSEDVQPEKAKEYIDVLDRQSQRLRKLTEDVIEASKASTGNIPVELEKEDMNVLLSQTAGEYEDKLREAGLEPVMSLQDGALNIMADGRLLWRVFDNIMSNAVKYALRGTRVYISSEMENGRAAAVFRNISASPLNISADELMERFVRGDASRNTQGSGLGLSIAESLVKLQGGEFSIEIDGDLFKAKVSFPNI